MAEQGNEKNEKVLYERIERIGDIVVIDRVEEKHKPGITEVKALDDSERKEGDCSESQESKEMVGQGYKNAELGRWGEESAAMYLRQRGLEILDRNWKCIFGEADIVCLDKHHLVFVEVKTRSDLNKGMPEEAITPKKRKKYEQIAACYIKDHDIEDIGIRFDVVAILLLSPGKAMIRHHINAWGMM